MVYAIIYTWKSDTGHESMARSVQGKESVYVETGSDHRPQNGLAISTRVSKSVVNVIVKHDGLEGTVIQNINHLNQLSEKHEGRYGFHGLQIPRTPHPPPPPPWPGIIRGGSGVATPPPKRF